MLNDPVYSLAGTSRRPDGDGGRRGTITVKRGGSSQGGWCDGAAGEGGEPHH